MFGFIKVMALLIMSHTVYDLMKEDRQKWIGGIRRFVAKKWHEAEQRVGVGNGKKGE